jgi:hypothetical protein
MGKQKNVNSGLMDWVKIDFYLMGLSKIDICKVLEKAVLENRLEDKLLFAYEGSNWISPEALEVMYKDGVTFGMKVRRVFYYPVFLITILGLRILSYRRRSAEERMKVALARFANWLSKFDKNEKEWMDTEKDSTLVKTIFLICSDTSCFSCSARM